MHYAIIAAGEGSRLRHEGVAKPKPLVELAGEPLVKRLCRIFAENHAESITVIVNDMMKDVEPYVRSLAVNMSVPLNVVVKSTPSSMHSFYEVTKDMPPGAKFIVTTVDTIFRPDEFARYVDAFRRSDADGCMGLTYYIDDEKPLYADTDDAGMVTAYRDTPNGNDRTVSAGIYGLTTAAIPVLQECLAEGVSRMRNYQRALLHAGLRLEAFFFDKVIDVDHAGDIEKAETFLNQ